MHGTGHYDRAIKMWEGLGNIIMMRKGSMGLANMTMQQRCGKAWEIQLRGGKEAWDWPI